MARLARKLGLLCWLCLVCSVLCGGLVNLTSAAQDTPPAPPFTLPLQGASGPATWLLEQFFGNTLEAYDFGKYWYAAGQGLHFGLDLEAPCGTPVIAIGDGVVKWVNNSTFGAGPNNLVLEHPDVGYVSVYGHLRERPTLSVGQPIERGQVIGMVGDPDLTCFSRPHLHLEIRSLDYRTIYDPTRLIAADWDLLATLGEPIGVRFAQSLLHPRRWQSHTDQPEVASSGRTLNNYAEVWPPSLRAGPTETTRPAFTAPAPAGSLITPRRIGPANCCAQFWWLPDSREIIYLDGPEGEIASVRARAATSGQARDLGTAPPALFSADGRYSVRVTNRTTVQDIRSGESWAVATRGAWPVISPGSKWLMWHIRPGDYLPNYIPPRTEIWLAPLNADPDQREPKLIRQQPGGMVYWLDDNRLLLVEQLPRVEQRYTLSIYHIDSEQVEPLAEVNWLRRLSIAPGGAHVLMFLPFQAKAEQSGLYLLATQPGAKPEKLPFVGGAQWRDSRTLVYIPYAARVDRASTTPMGLIVYDIERKATQRLNLAQGLRIRDDQWQVSPDGRAVAFVSARDDGLWVLEIAE